MHDLNYIIKTSTTHEQPELSVGLWKIGQDVPDHLWSSVRGDNYVDHEHPTVAEVPKTFVEMDGQLFMGMSSGYIKQIDLQSGRTVARYGPRLTISHGDPTPAPVHSLVLHDGKVYDASGAGLFETLGREKLDDRFIGSVEVAADRLLIVPHGANPRSLEGRDYQSSRMSKTPGGGQVVTHAPAAFRFADSIRESKAGNLIDVSNGEIVMERVEPFDGSGMSPGEHVIVGDHLYMHHGNYPGETITVRKFPTGETVVAHNVKTTKLLGEHNGHAIDYREGLGPNAIRRTDKDYDFTPIFTEPRGERITSVASGDDVGLLVALYNREGNKTRIINHQNPEENLLESPGRLSLTRL
ncbi:hypothetical protein HN865_03570 [Candidatus Woesearchaeota archaeon]|jgi:hypothetical protein|nr:hypothetical protein [Candidatus Woesearchaeota archaeon]